MPFDSETTLREAKSSVREGFIDIKEVARRLSVTTRTIKSWKRRGLIPCYQISRRTVRYRWPDVETQLPEMTISTGSSAPLAGTKLTRFAHSSVQRDACRQIDDQEFFQLVLRRILNLSDSSSESSWSVSNT